MRKLLLVEADALARAYLKSCYPWAQIGFVQITETESAEDALEICRAEVPDLVLIEAELPKCSGIWLTEQLRAQGFLVGILMLANNPDLTQVKNGMRAGADDYLVKTTLGMETLEAALRQVEESTACRRRAAEEQLQLRRMAEKGSRVAHRELLEELLSHEHSWEEQYTKTRQAGLRHRYYHCAVILVSMSCVDSQEAQRLFDCCRRIAAPYEGDVIDMGRGRYAVLYDFSEEHSSMRQREVLAQQSTKILCFSSARVKYRIGVSMVCQGGNTIARAVRQATEALALTFYGAQVGQYDESCRMSNTLPESCELFLRDLPLLIERGDRAPMEQEFHVALQELEVRRVQIGCVISFLRACDVAAGTPRAEQFYASLQTLEDCECCLTAYTEQADAVAHGGQGISPAISRAMQYVRRHYVEPIGLGHAAREVGLSLPYLSRKFKRETGMGVNEYLLECRMREVCHALETTLETIKVIATHAGFQDYQHFCKMFKKKFGVSPAQYRKEQLTSQTEQTHTHQAQEKTISF